MSQQPAAIAGASGSSSQRLDPETALGPDRQQPEVQGKYVQLQNIPDDDESADYVLEDVSQKTRPISYATAFNVGSGRPPIDFYWLAVAAAAVQGLLAPYLYLLELGCGLNLAHRSLQHCRMSRSYFARSEYELAALTAFKSGRYAGGSLMLSLLTAAVTIAAVLTICLAKPDTETALDFHFHYARV